MTFTILAAASARINVAFSRLTAHGGPYRFEHARPFAEGLDAAALKWAGVYGDGTEAQFELALTRYVNAVAPPKSNHGPDPRVDE